MKNIQLSPRLQKIADLVDPCKTFADIGTDHGYLPYYLMQSEIVETVYLCDVNKGPLDNARTTFQGATFERNAHYRLGSGLSVLKEGEVEAAVIAGMGGGLIQMLLEQAPNQVKELKQLILQPQTEQAQVRAFCLQMKWSFRDYFIREGEKFYEILQIDFENKNEEFIKLTEFDYEFGLNIALETFDCYLEFLNFKKRKYHKIMHSIQADHSDLTESQRDKYNFAVSKIEKIDCILESLPLNI